MTREEQILDVLRSSGKCKADEIFFTTAKMEVRSNGTHTKQAQEYLDMYEFGTGDSKWRTSGHYYLRKLEGCGKLCYYGSGMYSPVTNVNPGVVTPGETSTIL